MLQRQSLLPFFINLLMKLALLFKMLWSEMTPPVARLLARLLRPIWAWESSMSAFRSCRCTLAARWWASTPSPSCAFCARRSSRNSLKLTKTCRLICNFNKISPFPTVHCWNTHISWLAHNFVLHFSIHTFSKSAPLWNKYQLEWRMLRIFVKRLKS